MLDRWDILDIGNKNTVLYIVSNSCRQYTALVYTWDILNYQEMKRNLFLQLIPISMTFFSNSTGWIRMNLWILIFQQFESFFSSPELKVQVSYSDPPLSVVRLSVHLSVNFYIFNLFSRTAGPNLTQIILGGRNSSLFKWRGLSLSGQNHSFFKVLTGVFCTVGITLVDRIIPLEQTKLEILSFCPLSW